MKLVELVKRPAHAGYRYRLHAFEAALSQQGWEISLHSISGTWIRRLLLLHSLAPVDTLLLQRRLLTWSELRILRRLAGRFIYDFDDAVLYRSSYSAKGQHSRQRRLRFRATVQAADTVIAGNTFLAGLASRFTDPGKVVQIPTCVDPAGYQLARHDNEHGILQLVWIGSASTVRGFQRTSQHLEAVARAVPEARLKLVCDVFPKNLPIATIPCPWSAEREALELSSGDIGVSWMPDDQWSRGKCGLKVLQYMAAGLPVVANPVGVHCEMVIHGRTGFLASAPERWAESVRLLARNPELRRTMGAAGRERVCRHYSPQRWVGEFLRAVSGKTIDGTDQHSD